MKKKLDISTIEENTKDVLTSFVKGAFWAIPVVGPFAAEVFGTIIPMQRIDRMKIFLIEFERQFEKHGLKIELLEEKMKNDDFINLFDEVGWQAGKSTSKERKEYLASILINGLTTDKLDEIQKNIFLNLMSELNDIEILILYNHTMKSRTDKNFQNEHSDNLIEPLAYMGASQEEQDNNTLFKTYKEKLVRLNLLNKKFVKPKKNEFPEFDEKTGMMKSKSFDITPLGRLFLKYIGLLENDDI